MRKFRSVAVLLILMIATVLAMSSCESTGTESSVDVSEFPLSEPEYTSKRIRDFAPYEDALAALTEDRVTELDALVTGSDIAVLQDAMNQGTLSSEELVSYYVDRIRRYDVDKLNSVMELAPDALDSARALDAERAEGNVRGSLHGIPVLLKDNIATGDGTHTTAGAYALHNWRSDRDAYLVSRLREEGAIILGKANLSEWANYMDPSVPNGFSTLGGQTRHPYGPFDPFGSSSGSAVSVAAGLTTVSVGTETQGSIIMPSEANSVVSIKTSRGLVSRDNIIPLVDWMDVPGPIARSVSDAAILLSAMSGVDENDPATADAESLQGVDFTDFLDVEAAKGMRMGVLIWDDAALDAFLVKLQEQTPSLTEESIQQYGQATDAKNLAIAAVFGEAGMEIVEVSMSDLPSGPDVASSFEFGFQHAVNHFLDGLGENRPVANLAEVADINAQDMVNRAPYGQSYVIDSVNTSMTEEEYNVLVESGEQAGSELHSLLEKLELDVLLINDLTQIYAPAGFPAITVPVGYDDSGKPEGIVISGDYLSEPALITAAYVFEQAMQARIEPDLDKVIQSFEGVYQAPAELK